MQHVERNYDDLQKLAQSRTSGDWERRFNRVLANADVDHYWFRVHDANRPSHRVIALTNSAADSQPNTAEVDTELTATLAPLTPRIERLPGQTSWARSTDMDICQITVPIRNGMFAGILRTRTWRNRRQKQLYEPIQQLSDLCLALPFALEGLAGSVDMGSEPTALSNRELDCLRWCGLGKTSWEIGRIVGCTERTVNFHVANATRKLGAANRRHAVSIAAAQGLISLDMAHRPR